MSICVFGLREHCHAIDFVISLFSEVREESTTTNEQVLPQKYLETLINQLQDMFEKITLTTETVQKKVVTSLTKLCSICPYLQREFSDGVARIELTPPTGGNK